MLEYQNLDIRNIVTPINTEELEYLLKKYEYDKHKTQFLIQGFKEGFDIGYQGPVNRRSRSRNLPLSIGSPYSCGIR